MRGGERGDKRPKPPLHDAQHAAISPSPPNFFPSSQMAEALSEELASMYDASYLLSSLFHKYKELKCEEEGWVAGHRSIRFREREREKREVIGTKENGKGKRERGVEDEEKGGKLGANGVDGNEERTADILRKALLDMGVRPPRRMETVYFALSPDCRMGEGVANPSELFRERRKQMAQVTDTLFLLCLPHTHALSLSHTHTHTLPLSLSLPPYLTPQPLAPTLPTHIAH